MGDHHYPSTGGVMATTTPTHDEIMRHYDHNCVEVRMSGIHGYGVFAQTDLPKGSYVIEYIGRKMERATIFQVLSKEQGRYVFNLDEKWSIDGSVPENRAGRINHSCEGNCHIKKVDGHIWVGHGEELALQLRRPQLHRLHPPQEGLAGAQEEAGRARGDEASPPPEPHGPQQ
ncbi:SET domain protein [Acanthamoeba castellanii str. Neff]|uniref:SET domain protein n=1 Tax=Acanthamoeba castellanii (strain ATCC 30010 / Neff) TaxID=1257118 RepID=L8GTS4_ACACF|nr:SET domain protein [Acanthamoeba castellanii str. Neff]ELR16332.1 SET domain protein [Acanthamoeba castellanii str. Neff]